MLKIQRKKINHGTILFQKHILLGYIYLYIYQIIDIMTFGAIMGSLKDKKKR